MLAMLNWMKENHLPATELSSFIAAFRALSEQGKLTLAKTESADEFLKNHPELSPKDASLFVTSQQAKAAATAAHFAKGQAASAQAGSTTVVDYEPEQRGPLYANVDKQSFRALLRNLSAEEFQKRVSEDPQFRAAVDKLEK